MLSCFRILTIVGFRSPNLDKSLAQWPKVKRFTLAHNEPLPFAKQLLEVPYSTSETVIDHFVSEPTHLIRKHLHLDTNDMNEIRFWSWSWSLQKSLPGGNSWPILLVLWVWAKTAFPVLHVSWWLIKSFLLFSCFLSRLFMHETWQHLSCTMLKQVLKVICKFRSQTSQVTRSGHWFTTCSVLIPRHVTYRWKAICKHSLRPINEVEYQCTHLLHFLSTWEVLRLEKFAISLFISGAYFLFYSAQ